MTTPLDLHALAVELVYTIDTIVFEDGPSVDLPFNQARDAILAALSRVESETAKRVREETLEEAAAIAQGWACMGPSTFRLNVGECSSQEIRTAQAVAQSIALQVRSLKNVGQGQERQ